MRKNKAKPFLKVIILIPIILLAIFLIISYIWRALATWDYFKVREVISKEKTLIDFSHLKGRNIFSIDLAGESQGIIIRCPDCSQIRLARVFPDRIYVEFIKRKALAFLKLYRYFAIDQEGVLFYSPLDPNDSGLPIILGLETKIFGPKQGVKYNNKELSLALDIIEEANKNHSLRDYRIKKIDVAGMDNIDIFIPLPQKKVVYSGWQAPERIGLMEVKISQGNMKEKIAIMAGLINQEKYHLRISSILT
ncbi:MAG: hypothetical protein NTW13_06555 [Candidatus Omnitrophica bacterium]|nr:hypothetical protein [Candidatus Omnitrophota bacterium]